MTGLYYLPIVAIWCLMIERVAGFAAYWATIAMIFIMLTQHPPKAFFRGQGSCRQSGAGLPGRDRRLAGAIRSDRGRDGGGGDGLLGPSR